MEILILKIKFKRLLHKMLKLPPGDVSLMPISFQIKALHEKIILIAITI